MLAEIALTYRCQNRCTFCYASAPERGRKVPAMSTAEVKAVMDKIVDQAHVPSLSFTGGEPTVRRDLPELVALRPLARAVDEPHHQRHPLRQARAWSKHWPEAGLDSAQVSLEAGDAATHDLVVGRAGAFERTVQGIRNLRDGGIHVHTNTTINRHNREALHGLIDLAAEPGARSISR